MRKECILNKICRLYQNGDIDRAIFLMKNLYSRMNEDDSFEEVDKYSLLLGANFMIELFDSNKHAKKIISKEVVKLGGGEIDREYKKDINLTSYIKHKNDIDMFEDMYMYTLEKTAGDLNKEHVALRARCMIYIIKNKIREVVRILSNACRRIEHMNLEKSKEEDLIEVCAVFASYLEDYHPREFKMLMADIDDCDIEIYGVKVM